MNVQSEVIADERGQDRDEPDGRAEARTPSIGAPLGSESGAQSARLFSARWLFGTGGRSGRGKDEYDLIQGVRDACGGVNSDPSCPPRQAHSKPRGLSANSALGLVSEVHEG